MTEELIKAFEQKAVQKFVFNPEIKVKLTHYTFYISEMRKTPINSYLVVVEVGAGGDKAPVPLRMLDAKCLTAMHARLIA